ncbi:MAG TPA: class I SAM-dependent methyltransferase [Steroidobacteraceae bacterium]
MLAESAASLSLRARALYGDIDSNHARLQIWRPYICPFEEIAALVPRGGSILDVGCGAGLFLGLLADLGIIRAGHGFDSSKPAIDVARQMSKSVRSDVTLTIEHRDATAAWPEGEFDVVSIIDVMHHVPPQHHESVLDLALSRTRVGGLILYKDMARRPLWRAWCNQLHDLVLARQWIHHVPVESVDAWAAKSGMTIAAQGSANRLWYAHEWRLYQRTR